MDRPGHPSLRIPIFVGSTFEDMKDYRAAVMEALRRLETVVRGMEYFGARPGRPKDECLKAVRESRLYIGMFAMRYGTVDEETGRSMTQLELEEAERIGLPVLIYLIDEESQPVLPRYMDRGEDARKLAALKERLKKKHTVSLFTSPDDLARRVSKDVPRTLQEMGSLGCFEQLELRSAPVFSTPARLDFGKVTVIAGANGTGKTSLWQWAAGIGDEFHLQRWLRVRGFPDPLDVVVTFFDPVRRQVGVLVEDKRVSYTVDEEPVPIQPYTVQFVVPKLPREISEWGTMDGLSKLSAVFGLPSTSIARVIGGWLPRHGLVTGLEVAEEVDQHEVSVRLPGNSFYLPLAAISFGELMGVFVEIGTTLSGFFSQHTPTVLVLDEIATYLDNASLRSVIENLCAEEISFQTIVTVPDHAIDCDSLSRAGARVVWLEGSAPSVKIVSKTQPTAFRRNDG